MQVNTQSPIRSLLSLSWPIIIGQLGLMLVGTVDILVASEYSSKALAAIGVANSILNPIFLFGLGIMFGLSPYIAKKRGAGFDIDSYIGDILGFGLIIGMIVSFLILVMNQFVGSFGFDQEIVPTIKAYNEVVAWSFPFSILFQAIREYLQSFEDVFMANLISILAVFVNYFSNYLLVFGIGDFGGIGEIGLAYTTLVMRAFLFLSIFYYLYKKVGFISLSFSRFKELFLFCFPVGLTVFLEVGAFASLGFFSGQIGVIASATNSICLNLISLAFMVPLSIAGATSVKIGYFLGKKDYTNMKNYIYSSLYIVLGFSFITTACFFFFPEFLIKFFTKDQSIITLGLSLLVYACFLQFFDFLQVLLCSIFRGLQFVNIPTVATLISHWLIGIPLSYYLAFYQDWGLKGLWFGLCVSLVIMSSYLSLKLKWKLQGYK